ncbi:MAG: alpha/beta hydrolase family protein [Rhodanobacteraceae bacterium]
MPCRQVHALASLALLLMFSCATATAAPTPGATTAMQGLLPVSDFARHGLLKEPRLSPDGKHLLVREDDASGKDSSLVVYQLPGMSVVSQLRMPAYQVPLHPVWVNDDWIALEIGQQFGSLDEPLETGEVIASDITGRTQRYLFGWRNYGGDIRAQSRGSDEGMGFIVGRPETPNGHVYVRAEPFGREDLSILYDIDVPHNTRHLLAQMHVHGMQFLVSPEGNAAYAFGDNTDFDYVAYRQVGGQWVKLDFQKVGDFFDPLAYTPDHQHIYALIDPNGGPSELVTEALDGSQRKLLASNPFASIGDIQWTAPPSRPFAVMPAAGTPDPIALDPSGPDAVLYRGLQNALPDDAIDFINFDQDGGELLFYVSSDRDPGTYYLLDTRTHKASKLFSVAPWIDPKQMAERQPFRFKASDGMTLEAILTFPPNRARQNLPMVLVPHGGPYAVRDDWYYDPDAQFLANRGYLVLQVNFRGSAGRGIGFQHAGYGQWGTGIQQDLIDGVRWAIANHYADPNRICVYGGSFGGYSALMAVIRAPHLFKCAIGYAGVYDLGMLYSKGDIQSTKAGVNYLASVVGRDRATLAANSPDKLANKIDVPVFLAHGKDDQRAPFAGAEAMRDALEAAHKPFEWMAVPHEGHGFYTEQDRAAFLTRMQAFLARYIGPGAAPTQQSPGGK